MSQRTFLVAVTLMAFGAPASWAAQMDQRVAGEIQGSPVASVLPKGAHGSFEGTLQNLGGVVYRDGLFHMLYNDIQGGWPPSDIVVGYATSEDGVSWTYRGDNPVFSAAAVPYVPYVISAQSLVVDADGLWILYFDTPTQDVVGRAVAPTPAGPWVADPTPALAPSAGTWDAGGLAAPSVVRTDEGWVMLYAVFLGENNFGQSGGNPRMAIGRASSPDGLVWTKHDNPDTTDPLYAGSDPVLGPAGADAWDAYKVESPRVVRADDRWIMAYRADAGDAGWGLNTAYGLATSRDGVHWTRLQAQPFLSEDDVAEWATLWSAAALVHEDRLLLYVETDGRGVSGTRVNLATLALSRLTR